MIELKQKQDCCGCGACEQRCPQKCIVLQADEEGFLYPSVDKHTCIGCGLCRQVCPVLCPQLPRLPIQVFAAKNPEEQIRMASSSGGIFTMLAQRTIGQGGVVFGARFDEKWGVYHDYARTAEGIIAFRGSKYVQSRIGNSYIQVEKFLKEGLNVLFSGTPCQVAGLKRFLRRDYSNLLSVDVACHGVPSPLVWTEYLRKFSSVPKDKSSDTSFQITGISFRNKSAGWKNFRLQIQAENQTAPFYETFGQNVYTQGFLYNLYLRPSCHACSARSGKSGSDLTLGDYWGISHWHPRFDDDKGVGLVLVYSQKGAAIFNDLGANVIPTTYKQALAGNVVLEKDMAEPGCRSEFWQRFRSEGTDAIAPLCRKLRPTLLRRLLAIGIRVTKRMISKV